VGAAFADQPLGRSILGSEASIGRITVEDLHGWKADRYRAPALILAAAGKVEHDALVALAERTSRICPQAGLRRDVGALLRRHRVGRTPSEQAQITFAFEGRPSSTRLPCRATVRRRCRRRRSSRLFQELREERGLAYAVSATLHPYSDTGIFYVHAATARAEAAAATRLIEEILDAAVHDLSQRELDRMRTRARAGLLMHLETPWGQASYAARQLAIHARLVEPQEAFAKLDAVTLDQARAPARRCLPAPGPARPSACAPSARREPARNHRRRALGRLGTDRQRRRPQARALWRHHRRAARTAGDVGTGE
jgi:predicted Zn-dependent peptidase